MIANLYSHFIITSICVHIGFQDQVDNKEAIEEEEKAAKQMKDVSTLKEKSLLPTTN